MMLAWLVITAARPWPRSSLRSSSRPTRNMKNTSPIWLSALRKPRLTGGKSAWKRSGAAQPRSDVLSAERVIELFEEALPGIISG